MLKKRLIFTLHYYDGMFTLSRNFRLQKVGDINWLKKNYNFAKTAKFLDELIVLNVRPENENKDNFAKVLREISKDCFIPISAGGGITTIEDAKLLLKNGADKIVVNSAIHNDSKLIIELCKNFGSQCVIASIDYKFINDFVSIYIENGTKLISNDLNKYLKKIVNLGVGECLLNSITKDGTGTGLDLKILESLNYKLNLPLIFAGGVGNWNHLYEGFKNKKVDAVSTANLFNFISDGIEDARKRIIKSNINLPNFA